jgi:hypothetical protein
MNADVADQVRALRDMTIRELQQRWQELFGEATRTGNRHYLIKRLAWRIQADAEGDISERARQRRRTWNSARREVGVGPASCTGQPGPDSPCLIPASFGP